MRGFMQVVDAEREGGGGRALREVEREIEIIAKGLGLNSKENPPVLALGEVTDGYVAVGESV